MKTNPSRILCPPWRCQECRKKFTTLAAVKRAMSVGCPKCNSGDIQQEHA